VSAVRRNPSATRTATTPGSSTWHGAAHSTRLLRRGDALQAPRRSSAAPRPTMPAAWRPAAAAGRTAAGAEARAGAAVRRAARAHTGDRAPSACIAPEGKGVATLARALRRAAPAPADSAWATRARPLRRG
jgi:hypothetical protein